MSTPIETLEQIRNKESLKKITNTITQLQSGNITSTQQELVETLNLFMITASPNLRNRLENMIIKNLNKKNVHDTYLKTKSDAIKQACLAYKKK